MYPFFVAAFSGLQYINHLKNIQSCLSVIRAHTHTHCNCTVQRTKMSGRSTDDLVRRIIESTNIDNIIALSEQTSAILAAAIGGQLPAPPRPAPAPAPPASTPDPPADDATQAAPAPPHPHPPPADDATQAAPAPPHPHLDPNAAAAAPASDASPAVERDDKLLKSLLEYADEQLDEIYSEGTNLGRESAYNPLKNKHALKQGKYFTRTWDGDQSVGFVHWLCMRLIVPKRVGDRPSPEHEAQLGNILRGLTVGLRSARNTVALECHEMHSLGRYHWHLLMGTA